eukprot:TRINITY_DN51681_c0_g1_i1.p1 TRINITY_DN51681_c0_g1~~TRINITY_DN51681_c0_g1_i1.p1  ORF type:complete len:131 (-),score=13.50 TRINITY_DN51681_c0_g1_i1:400-792(-)
MLHKDSTWNNDTWELVPHFPHMNFVGCKWVFKTKLHFDRTLKLKGTLCDRKPSLKFLVSTSLKLILSSGRQLLKPCLLRCWLTSGTSVSQFMDIKNAFLTSRLSEPVYMEQRAGSNAFNGRIAVVTSEGP